MARNQNMHLPPLFIGRFQPFHLGHLDAIRQILRRHKRIIIGIGSSQYAGTAENPFSAEAREKMIRRGLRASNIPKKKWVIVRIPDIHDDNKWVSHAEKLAPLFGEVWSGTKKVQKLFRKDGGHRIVNPLINVKISGTKIRKLMRINKRWEHLVPRKTACLIKKLWI